MYSSADIDECTTDNGGCEQSCLNNNGSYSCTCSNGYGLVSNQKNCSGKHNDDTVNYAYMYNNCNLT